MFDSTDIATVISICGLCMPPMQMLVYPRLAGKLGARDTFGALSWLLCICLLTLPFTSPLHAGGEGGIWSPNGIALICNYCIGFVDEEYTTNRRLDNLLHSK